MVNNSASKFIKELISEFQIDVPEGIMFTKDFDSSRPFYFFRGHSDSKWKLLPNCARKGMKREFVSLKESNFKIDIEKLAHWQHYQKELNKTTRLLDFTSSLYVGLYFACCDNFDKDGELFIMRYAPDYYQWERVKEATYYLRCNEDREYTNKSIYEVYKYSMLEEGLTPKDYFSMICEINDTFSYGRLVVFDEDYCMKTNNARLLKQKGALFFCPSDIRFEVEKNSTKKIAKEKLSRLRGEISSITSNTAQIEFYINVHKIIEPEWLLSKEKNTVSSRIIIRKKISKELKQDILAYLEEKGITKESLGL